MDTMSLAVYTLGLVALAYWAPRLLQYLHVRKQVRGIPVAATIHSGLEVFESFFRSILPHVRYIFPIKRFTPGAPFKKYETACSDLIAVTQMTTPYPVYITSSPSLAHTILTKTAIFHRANEAFRYRAVNIFGENILTVQNGPEHRRHRNVIKGCFGEEIMRSAWLGADECFDIMIQGLGLEGGGVMRDVVQVMVRYTLITFGKVGFSQDSPWTPQPSADGNLTLVESIDIFEHTSAAQLLLPLWLLRYSPFKVMRHWGRGQTSLVHHINTMIADRRARLASSPTDILTALVAGQELSEKGQRLAEDEMFGDVFIMILAEHHTTAYTLAFLISFLVLRPEIQEKMYNEISSTNGSYADINKLSFCLDCLYETIRLRDIILYLSKRATEDVSVPYTTWSPDSPTETVTRTHTIKAGSRVVIDTMACSLNPTVFPDPAAFRPERWAEAAANDVDLKSLFLGCSLGQRGCIGKRFAEVEMLAVLVRLIGGYRIEPVRLDGETEGAMAARYMETKETLTLGPRHWDVRLVKR